jgi:uncharacterized protein (UPF0297 family)
MNKNLLSENMLRFGTKNLSEGQKRKLVLESVMETIKEHGLHNEVKRRLNEGKTVEETVDKLWDAFSNFGSSDINTVVSELLSLAPGKQYNEASNLMYTKYGIALMPAIAKYCPGDEVRKPSNRAGLSIVDAMMRLWYPGAFKEATKNGTEGTGGKDLTGVYSAYFDKDPLKTIATNRTGWQKTMGQFGGTTGELSSGG